MVEPVHPLERRVLDRIDGSPGAPPPYRAFTLVRRLDAFEALKARAELCRTVVQIHLHDLESTLAGLTASVENMLNERAAA